MLALALALMLELALALALAPAPAPAPALSVLQHRACRIALVQSALQDLQAAVQRLISEAGSWPTVEASCSKQGNFQDLGVGHAVWPAWKGGGSHYFWLTGHNAALCQLARDAVGVEALHKMAKLEGMRYMTFVSAVVVCSLKVPCKPTLRDSYHQDHPDFTHAAELLIPLQVPCGSGTERPRLSLAADAHGNEKFDVEYTEGEALWTRDAFHNPAARSCKLSDPFVFLGITTLAHDTVSVDENKLLELRAHLEENFNRDMQSPEPKPRKAAKRKRKTAAGATS